MNFTWNQLQKKLFNVFSQILRETNLLVNNITWFQEFFCENNFKKKLFNVFSRILRETNLGIY